MEVEDGSAGRRSVWRPWGRVRFLASPLPPGLFLRCGSHRTAPSGLGLSVSVSLALLPTSHSLPRLCSCPHVPLGIPLDPLP